MWIKSSKLQDLCQKISEQSLKDLFLDPNRLHDFSIKNEDMLFDYSKSYLTSEILHEFLKIAKEIQLEEYIDAMFKGHKINFTENRAVLHVALRNKTLKPVKVDGHDYYNEIWQTLENMTDFAEKVRNGEVKGATNKTFTDIINIGIGGSSLPLQMAYLALLPYKRNDINVHFVSNVDIAALTEVTKSLNPETTLILVASKTFTTEETMMNAKAAKKWLTKALGENAVANHFVALSTNLSEVSKFGIKKQYTFGFWDFVGGRYSLWSSIGLALVIAIGKNNFLELLRGASLSDQHFKETPLNGNIPFIMAIISVMYRNFFNYAAEAILPYSHYLRKFPAYMQQVSMESNGKSVNKDGEHLNYNTGYILFGEPGTDSQHSFYQLLHQGTTIVPVDFIGFIKGAGDLNHQDTLIANMIAQSEAFMVGKSKSVVKKELASKGLTSEEINQLAPHKEFKGNRPSNVFLFKELTPKTLGMLCAFYEHKVFVEGVFWGINSFDQWGVELGKELAKVIKSDIANAETAAHDPSTTALIEFYKKGRRQDGDL